MNCSQQQLNWNQTMPPGWDPQQMRHLNGSNMSLNLPPQAYYPQQQQHQLPQAPPPAWINSWGAPPNMYPYPVNMMPMNQGRNTNLFLFYFYKIIYFSRYDSTTTS